MNVLKMLTGGLNPAELVSQNLPHIESLIFDELEKAEQEKGQEQVILINKLRLSDGTKKIIVSIANAERDSQFIKVDIEKATKKGFINFVQEIIKKFTN